MADFNDIQNKVISLTNYIDENVSHVERASIVTQELIFKMIQEEILKFEIKEATFVVGQDLRKRLASIERRVEEILNSKSFQIPIRDFLTDFTTIQDRTIDLFKSVNNLEVQIKELNPAKQIIYDQARNALTKAMAAEYVEPVKKLIAQNVLQARSIRDTVSALEKWNKGDMASGRLANGTPTPNLQKYATQIARDTAFSVQRTTNNIFKEKYGLTKFFYGGGLVKDSRPLCRYLVNLNRIIDIDEMPPLIRQFPEGLYPNTTRENFMEVCGGYGCMHVAHAI